MASFSTHVSKKSVIWFKRCNREHKLIDRRKEHGEQKSLIFLLLWKKIRLNRKTVTSSTTKLHLQKLSSHPFYSESDDYAMSRQ